LGLSSDDTVRALRQELVEAARDAPRRVLIDLTHLEFMDSAGLALVVDARKAAEAAGHELHLRSGSPQVQRLFTLTGVIDRFEFEE
jgi:anti-sigma B factor antagonist